MSLGHYRGLFRRVLRVRPETAKLEDICRVLFDLEFEDKTRLMELAFHKGSGQKERLDGGHPAVKQEKGDEKEIDNMRGLSEFQHLLKKQFLLPDMIFDHRLLRHELMVERPAPKPRVESWDDVIRRRSQPTEHQLHLRQKTYVLLDVSGSTAQAHRLEIQKAIAIAYLENHHKQRGEVWYRAFNQRPGSLHHASEGKGYRKILNEELLTATPVGYTRIDRALDQAVEDLSHHPSEHPAEILVLTDGLCAIDLELQRKNLGHHRLHIVVVGARKGLLSDRELREHFDKDHHQQLQALENLEDESLRRRRLDALDLIFKKKKGGLQDELTDRWSDDLRALCVTNGGLFLSVPDLPNIDRDAQVADLKARLEELKSMLETSEGTVLEREQLMDEILALRNYLGELEGELSPQQRDELFGAYDELKSDLKEDQEWRAMMEGARVRWKGGAAAEPGDPFQFFRWFQKAIQEWLSLRQRP